MLATSRTVREGLDALLSYLRLLLDQASLEIHEEADVAICRFRLFNDDCARVPGFMLGFSEPSAFSRAFKRWTDSSPMKPRKALAESRDSGAAAWIDLLDGAPGTRVD